MRRRPRAHPMPARPVWSGFTSFGLVTVPVRAFSSSNSLESDVKLNQLHRDCNSRIQYKKTCPIHVAADDLVLPHLAEFAAGQYVTFDPAELENLRSAKDKTINITAFIPPHAVDP